MTAFKANLPLKEIQCFFSKLGELCKGYFNAAVTLDGGVSTRVRSGMLQAFAGLHKPNFHSLVQSSSDSVQHRQ